MTLMIYQLSIMFVDNNQNAALDLSSCTHDYDVVKCYCDEDSTALTRR